MKFDSPLYDRIRVKPGEDRRLQAERPCCDWPNCAERASHRATKGRNRAHGYWRFSLADHRGYKKCYHFFFLMSENPGCRLPKGMLTQLLTNRTMGQNGGKKRRNR